LIDLLGFRLWN